MSESDSSRWVKDKLASINADIEQAQALLNEARTKWPNDKAFNETLDKQQFELDVRREQVRLMKKIEQAIEP